MKKMVKIRRDRESKSDTELEKNEEQESESKADEDNSTTSSSNEEEEAQAKKKEIAKGKKHMDVQMEDEVMSDVEYITEKAKGIRIREAHESQTDDKSKLPATEGPYVVLSSYKLRTGMKGMGVKTDSEPQGKGKKRRRGLRKTVSLTSGLNELESAQTVDVAAKKRWIKGKGKQQRKGKGKKQEEADVFGDAETDTEEACRRIKKGRRKGDDSDGDGAGAGGAGAGIGGANIPIQA